MGTLSPWSPEDQAAAEALLAEPPGVHLYLRSRLGRPGTGRAFSFRRGPRIGGAAWFGSGRNLVLAGEDPAFLDALAHLARERERGWIMVLGPHDPVSGFLERYLRLTERRPRLDRRQVYYLQRAETLPPLREERLRKARESDLSELAAAAARMSAEDFEIDPWRIDRTAVRRGVQAKIREGRAYVYREEGRLAFKLDLAIREPYGGQVEGVYTVEDRRGRGIATRCMAELGHRQLRELPCLGLHVAEKNTPARRAYERAGYRPVADLRLAIF